MSVDLLVLGAGISGLMAAHQAQRFYPNWRIELMDKGVQVGGRLATRRLGESAEPGVVDHGAQFFTLGPTSLLDKVVNDALHEGWIRQWACRPTDSSEAYICASGMTTLAKHLASPFTIHLNKRAVTIEPQPDARWLVIDQDGQRYHAQRVLITFPLPQSLALLSASNIALPDHLPVDLSQIAYHPCLAVLGLASDTSNIGSNGALMLEEGSDIAWIANNHQKGVSPKPAFTVHAAPHFSERHYNESDADILARLGPQIEASIGQPLKAPQVKRWRYSLVKDHPEALDYFAQRPFCVISTEPFLALCGDAFTTGRVASAAWSGCQVVEQCLA